MTIRQGQLPTFAGSSVTQLLACFTGQIFAVITEAEGGNDESRSGAF